jgi:hypothetical protein
MVVVFEIVLFLRIEFPVGVGTLRCRVETPEKIALKIWRVGFAGYALQDVVLRLLELSAVT